MATVEFYDGQTATLGTVKDAMQYAVRDCILSPSEEENSAVKKITDENGVVWEDASDDSIIELLLAADFSEKEFNSFVAIAHKEAGK